MSAPGQILAACDHAAALEHVRDVVARSGTSFLWGMRVLPRARREAMYAIYAFCREVDDIADTPEEEPSRRLRLLGEWRTEIERLYEGRPSMPVARALKGPVEAFDLPREEFLAILDGMAMDVRDAMRAPSWAELKTYCRRVAGAVGLLSIGVFGAREPDAPEMAVALGEALQLTNILRDLGEDAAMGRLYLPRPLLQEHGIESDDPHAVLAHSALPGACAALGAVARERFERSRALLALCDRRRMRPCILMMEVYERLLARIERQGWHPTHERVRVSRLEKLWILFRHGLI